MAGFDDYSFEFDDGEDESPKKTDAPTDTTPIDTTPTETSTENFFSSSKRKGRRLNGSTPSSKRGSVSLGSSRESRGAEKPRAEDIFKTQNSSTPVMVPVETQETENRKLTLGGSRLGERSCSERNTKNFFGEESSGTPPSSTHLSSSASPQRGKLSMSRSASTTRMGVRGREEDTLDTDADEESVAYVEKIREASPNGVKTRRRTLTGTSGGPSASGGGERVGGRKTATNFLRSTKDRGKSLLKSGQSSRSPDEEDDELFDICTMTMEESYSFCTGTLGKMHVTMVLMSELLKLDYGTATGIFRISSGTAELKKTHLQLLRYYQLPNSTHFTRELELNSSVHCLAGMLKRYFREVEPPIIPYSLYGDVITKGKELFIKLHEKLSEDSSSSAQAEGGNQFGDLLGAEMLTDLFDIIWSLPIENRTIFSWLMLCLFGVSLCEEKTKMGPENIALVFGPNLMRFSANPTPTESMKMLEDSSVITLITGVLIRHARDLFSFIQTKENEQNQTNLMKFAPFVDDFREISEPTEESGDISPEKPVLAPTTSQTLSSFVGNLAQKYQKSQQQEENSLENSIDNLYSEIEGVMVGSKGGEEGVPEGVAGVVLTVGYLVQLLIKKRGEEGEVGVGEVRVDELLGLAWEGEEEKREKEMEEKEEKEKEKEKEEKEEEGEEQKNGDFKQKKIEQAQEELCDLLCDLEF